VWVLLVREASASGSLEAGAGLAGTQPVSGREMPPAAGLGFEVSRRTLRNQRLGPSARADSAHIPRKGEISFLNLMSTSIC